jgi:hypothetical protein
LDEVMIRSDALASVVKCRWLKCREAE